MTLPALVVGCFCYLSLPENLFLRISHSVTTDSTNRSELQVARPIVRIVGVLSSRFLHTLISLNIILSRLLGLKHLLKNFVTNIEVTHRGGLTACLCLRNALIKLRKTDEAVCDEMRREQQKVFEVLRQTSLLDVCDLS